MGPGMDSEMFSSCIWRCYEVYRRALTGTGKAFPVFVKTADNPLPNLWIRRTNLYTHIYIIYILINSNNTMPNSIPVFLGSWNFSYAKFSCLNKTCFVCQLYKWWKLEVFPARIWGRGIIFSPPPQLVILKFILMLFVSRLERWQKYVIFSVLLKALESMWMCYWFSM